MTPLLRLSSVVMLVGNTLLTGCFGYDRILFITKTNVGLDVENKPPTAEITIARRELAIAPTFQDTTGEDQTPPLLASFGRTGGFFTTGLTAQFAGGNAALWLAEGTKDSNGNTVTVPKISTICLDKEPDTRPPLKKLRDMITGGKSEENTRAFYFATDTTFGLKVGWDGTGGPYPTNLKLGYNRKELAFPPVFVKKVEKDGDGICPKDSWKVEVPSFMASLDNESSVAGALEAEGNKVSHVQFFATGRAATGWAQRPEVNDKAYKEMRGVE